VRPVTDLPHPSPAGTGGPPEGPASGWNGLSRGGRIAASMLAAIVLAALLAPWLSPHDPSAMVLETRLDGPSTTHWLGRDELGRDVLSRLLHGARTSLAVGLAVVTLAGGFGVFVGGVAGLTGGWVDGLLMRTTDLFLSFPGILLAIALVAILGPGLDHAVLALVAIGWVGYARLVRGEVQRLRRAEFVLAAQTVGVPGWRLFLRHLLPNLAPLLLVQASLGVAGAITAEAGLSFLGLGAQPPTASWGGMIQGGRAHLLDAPHVSLVPGAAIFVTVLALNLLGEAMLRRSGQKV
jgi:peptide/nickel transport system permease protein